MECYLLLGLNDTRRQMCAIKKYAISLCTSRIGEWAWAKPEPICFTRMSAYRVVGVVELCRELLGTLALIRWYLTVICCRCYGCGALGHVFVRDVDQAGETTRAGQAQEHAEQYDWEDKFLIKTSSLETIRPPCFHMSYSLDS